jgi:hypothetical protein
VINVLTVHWQSPKWIDPQLSYLERNVGAPYRVFASLNGIDAAAVASRFHFAADLSGTHAEKLNDLASIAIEQSDPSDILLFLDGDAFPVAPLTPWLSGTLATHRLAAVRRDENFGDPQPHPCFCVTTAAFWKEIGGDWRPGTPWVNDVGTTVADVGGTLLAQLHDRGAEWLPLLRTNTNNPHALLFGVYAHRVYHHGAGFRSVPTRVDLHRQAQNRPSLQRPSLGTLRTSVAADPSKLLRLRPRHAGVAVSAVQRTMALRRDARTARSVDTMADRMFAKLLVDPGFSRELDSAEE